MDAAPLAPMAIQNIARSKVKNEFNVHDRNKSGTQVSPRANISFVYDHTTINPTLFLLGDIDSYSVELRIQHVVDKRLLKQTQKTTI